MTITKVLLLNPPVGPKGDKGDKGDIGIGIPMGGIILWSGLLVDIPSTWALCDGTLGTPDLRGRFIKGTAAGVDPGLTGGSDTHTHTDHPALSHAGTAVANHAAAATSAASDSSRAGVAGSAVPLATHTHNTPILAHAVTQPSDHDAQSHAASNSEPAYYTIAYIMKL